MNPANIPAYMDHLESVRKNTNHIKIRTGLEVDFFEGREDEIRNFLCSLAA